MMGTYYTDEQIAAKLAVARERLVETQRRLGAAHAAGEPRAKLARLEISETANRGEVVYWARKIAHCKAFRVREAEGKIRKPNTTVDPRPTGKGEGE